MISISSISDLCKASEKIQKDYCRGLIPEAIFERFGIDRETFLDGMGRQRLQIIIRCERRVLGVRITNPDFEIDPIFSVFFSDYYDEGVECIGLNINEPESERYQIDLDEFGKLPYGEAPFRRNINEEALALRAGLAPGQVRRGLRLLGNVIKAVEHFIHRLGREFLYCEAMTYHNAITYEKHGFYYQFNAFLDEMIWIHREFLPPDGLLFKKLDSSNTFRQRGFEKTVRGRSWAIHDGILGRDWNRPTMVKVVGMKGGICTFVDAIY